MPLRVGGCVVFAYHNVHDAPRLHAQLKESHIDAAVMDHAYFLSPLQLAVAWQRAQQDGLFDTQSHTHHNYRHADEPVARGLFLGLSASNNLNRALQVLTAGPATTAVVVLVREDDLDQGRRETLERIAQACQGIAHEVDPVVPGHVHVTAATTTSSSSSTTADKPHDAGEDGGPSRFVAARTLAEYHQISAAEARAVRQSFSHVDECRFRHECEQAGLSVPPSGPVWEELLNLKALEVCVVQKLALYDC